MIRSLLTVSSLLAVVTLLFQVIPSTTHEDTQAMSPKDRIRGSLFGALVADAMTLGSHYEYDALKIKQAYGGTTIAKYMAPGEQMGGETHGIGWGARNYHPGTVAGDQTDYGQYNILILEYLARKNQGNDASKLNMEALSFFEIDDDFLQFWETQLFLSGSWKQWICTQSKQTRQQYDYYGRGIPNIRSKLGGNSNAMAIRSVPFLAVSEDETQVVEYAARAMFTHRERTAHVGNEFFTRVAFRLVHAQNDSPRYSPLDAIQDVAKDMNDPWLSEKVQQALDKVSEATNPEASLSHEELVDDLALTSMARLWDVGKSEPIKVGKASPTEGTLPGSIYFIVKYMDDSPERAFQANAMVGGDNASRSIAIGMVLGAYHGVQSMDSDNSNVWRTGLRNWDHVDQLLQTMPLLVTDDTTTESGEL